jgi:hypothetical protein
MLRPLSAFTSDPDEVEPCRICEAASVDCTVSKTNWPLAETLVPSSVPPRIRPDDETRTAPLANATPTTDADPSQTFFLRLQMSVERSVAMPSRTATTG